MWVGQLHFGGVILHCPTIWTTRNVLLLNLIYDLVMECKIIRVRFGRFYLLIIDTFFWWSYFALPHHMDHKECALANLMYDLVIECKIIRV